MKLNKTQIQYALERVNAKIADKKKEIKVVRSKLNDSEAIYEFLKASNAPIKSKKDFLQSWNESYYMNNIVKLLNIPAEFDKEYHDFCKASTDFDEKYNKIKEDIKDKLYLCGDAEEALSLINSI
jgi:hypothetical protein